MQDRLHSQKNKSCWSILNNIFSLLTPKKLFIFCLLASAESLQNSATSKKQPLTYEFTVSGNSGHVDFSVGNIVVDANTPMEEVLALRQKQREEILKHGGVSIRTVITAGSKVESVTTGVNNVFFAPQPKDAAVEKNENIKENEKNITAKIPLTGKEEAIIVVEKTEGKKNDIKITWYISNFFTGVTIKWDDKQQFNYIEKSGTYHVDANNFSSSWKTDEEIAALQERARSSTFNGMSSTIFKADSKSTDSEVAPNKAKTLCY